MLSGINLGSRKGIGGVELGSNSLSSIPSSGGSPTVFTLVLDDLLTRHYPGTDQRFKLSLTSPTAGDSDWIEIDDNATIYSASVIAADMQTKLRAVAGYAGKVSVSGASSEAGDKYTFTVSFDGSLIGVGFGFNGASQFYPTITLTEAVTQQGVAYVAGVAAVFTLTCDVGNSADSNAEQVNLSSGGNVVFGDDGIIVESENNPFGWTRTSGGMGSSYATFTKNESGAASLSIISQTSDGSYSLTEDVVGVDAVTGQQEIHTITPAPVNPTGGTWKPLGVGSAIAYNAASQDIDDQIGTGFDGFGQSVSGTLDAGVVTVASATDTNVSDTALSPVNVSLTAPEITHSIN